MATDKSEPKTALILQLGVFIVVLLIGIRFSLVSYFNGAMDAEYDQKVASHKSEPLAALRAQEQKSLSGGAMPIDKAMTLVATKPRDQLGQEVAPQQSEDLAPMIGWGLTPRPEPVVVHIAVTDAGEGDAATDGGAEGGAVPLTAVTGDAGAGRATPAPNPTPKKAP